MDVKIMLIIKIIIAAMMIINICPRSQNREGEKLDLEFRPSILAFYALVLKSLYPVCGRTY